MWKTSEITGLEGRWCFLRLSLGGFVEVVFNGNCSYMESNLHSNYGMIDICIYSRLANRFR